MTTAGVRITVTFDCDVDDILVRSLAFEKMSRAFSDPGLAPEEQERADEAARASTGRAATAVQALVVNLPFQDVLLENVPSLTTAPHRMSVMVEPAEIVQHWSRAENP